MTIYVTAQWKVMPNQECLPGQIYHWLLAACRWHPSTQSSGANVRLTHWCRDKMAAIFQTTFSIAFSWMKMYEFWLRFHCSLFPRVKLAIFHICSDNGLAPVRRQAIIWTNDGSSTDADMRHSASVSWQIRTLNKMADILQRKLSNLFIIWKLLYFDSNSTKMCSHGPS